ncbi:MAG: leucyl aminopeptidase [Planctomycetaceae bacterium]|nr:leucyl aminopeptidase [Planctomycetaceae bacterium]
MESRVIMEPLASVSADWLIVGVTEGAGLKKQLVPLDEAIGGQITRLRESGDVTGKLGETLIVPDAPGIAATRLLIIGLGDEAKLDRSSLRKAFTTAALQVSRQPKRTLACAIPEIDRDLLSLEAVAQEMATSLTVGCVGPGVYQSDPGRHAFASVTYLVPDGSATKEIETAVGVGHTLGDAVNLVRELVNRTAADVYPETFAQRAGQIAQELGLQCDILDEARIKQERMGSLMGVAQGSDRPPRVVILRYQGGTARDPVTALIGKGVTFDSGGLSLKPTDSMKTMKCDMAGAATVLGVMSAVARLKLPVNVVGAVGLVENMVSGSSYKLGDVLTARNGTTIEVLNTDAEGRLVLADVLSYVVDQKVDRMIDLATLTGSCVIALGENITGAFTNDQAWCDQVLSASNSVGERIWQLPMDEEFAEQLKSDVADIKNVGTRWGGASIAAKFLEKFVAGVPWVHLDIAGPSFTEKSTPQQESGGTGVMVRTLVELLTPKE